jgi:hypothetical protein
LCACGGGGGDDKGGSKSATITVSGNVTDDVGVALAGLPVHGSLKAFCPSPIAIDWFGHGVTDASGNYVVPMTMNDTTSCLNHFSLVMQTPGCNEDRNLRCYLFTENHWIQENLAPRVLNLVAERKGRLYGAVSFSGGFYLGNAASAPYIELTSSSGDTQIAPIVNGAFVLLVLSPDQYTVTLGHLCTGMNDCRDHYDLSPPISTFTSAKDDVDIALTITTH